MGKTMTIIADYLNSVALRLRILTISSSETDIAFLVFLRDTLVVFGERGKGKREK
jgi:hypothetical protein